MHPSSAETGAVADAVQQRREVQHAPSEQEEEDVSHSVSVQSEPEEQAPHQLMETLQQQEGDTQADPEFDESLKTFGALL